MQCMVITIVCACLPVFKGSNRFDPSKKIISTKQSAIFNNFRLIFNWYSGKIDSFLLNSGGGNDYFSKLLSQLEILWQRNFL